MKYLNKQGENIKMNRKSLSKEINAIINQIETVQNQAAEMLDNITPYKNRQTLTTEQQDKQEYLENLLQDLDEIISRLYQY